MKDKVVVITGGSSGIGKALAFEFGRNGSNIFITGRTKEALDETIAELRESGINAASLVSDASKEEDNKSMVEEAINQFGKIDVLINNAGISMRALFEDVDLDVIRKVMDINFFGAVYATKYALPHIIKNKGSILGISSIAGYRGLPARAGYSASKFALQGFLEVIRTELLNKDVHVLTACPGFTASNIRKKSLTKDGSAQMDSPKNEQKIMSAETVAKHIYRATKKRKKFLTLTTEGKLAVFMNKWVPGLMDRIIFNKMAKEPGSPLK
ncbi:MAG: SDR family oxidoreductase [Cyclobacteriaceae bacterium]|nr:SDR family oxidoreductase [Cyclobacteriaceae bacterium]